MFGCEVLRPTRMIFEPVAYVVGVVSEEVVADDVPIALGIAGINRIEEVDERQGVVVLRDEAEEFAAPDVVGTRRAVLTLDPRIAG